MRDMDTAHQRLLNQRIAGQKFTTAEEVVRWMGGLQAQDYAQSLWAIGVRTESAAAADIEQAVTERKIVRTWPMRGTLHFVLAEDAPWMLELLAPRRLAGVGARHRELELDDRTLERSKELFYAALKDAGQLTRAEMLKLLENAGISPKGQRGYHILWHAAQTGLICLGPMQGKEQTFVLLADWVQSPRRLSRQEALAELARRYFASHGPAALEDFAGWIGLSLTEARAGLEAAKQDLVYEWKHARQYWSAKHSPVVETEDLSGVHLLPGFDEYLLGYKDRRDVLAPERAPKVAPGGNGIFFPIVVVDGQVAGTWKRAFKKNALNLTLSLFTQGDVSKDRFTAAAESYSDFMRLPLESLEIKVE